MELKEIYEHKRIVQVGGYSHISPKISFEIFPPKDGNISNLFDDIRLLKKYNPVLISLTYGAGGKTQEFSLEILKMLIDLEYTVMPHFTCVSLSREQVAKHIIDIENLGIENILALRGDIPEGMNVSMFDFHYANELVDFIHQKTTLSIGVAGYPECHIESHNIHNDIENLKRKVDAGASAIFTQLFFDNDKFYRYVDLVRKASIELPIISGIMPVRSLKHVKNMVNMTHVEIPQKLTEQLEKFPDDALKIGIEFATNQCHDLLDNGVDGLHFFTLNHSDQVSEILDNILF